MTRKQKIIFDAMPGPKAKRTSIAAITNDCCAHGMMIRDIWAGMRWLVDNGHVDLIVDKENDSRYRYRQAEAVTV